MKYSDIMTSLGGRKMRYNYSKCLLEWITFDIFDDDMNITKLSKPEVIDSIGLSKENFEEDKVYWMNRYDASIDEELYFM